MSGEEATEETREETTVAPAVVPERKPSKEEYVCSVCGATVVPERIKTPTSITTRCPECEKFMNPLSEERGTGEGTPAPLRRRLS